MRRVSGPGPIALVELELGGPPESWARLGFALSGGALTIGTTSLRPTGAGGGIRGWTLSGLASAELDGLPTTLVAAAPRPEPGVHPNGAERIDHVVAATAAFERTAAALETAGLELRRTRQATPEVRQGFFWVGDTILELVEDPRAAAPRFWGLTVTVADLDRAADLLGDALGDVRPAIQPGRRIATVRREAGHGVPLALMSPHVRVEAPS
ncbi:MAG: hypothetical protein QOJ07_349 [Thermoleophilaceae bacterium]|nr:hypothetical protein [Thermoleophilaceae bacterium]